MPRRHTTPRTTRNTSNAADGIYQGGGSQLLFTPVAEGDGYAATLDIALQL